MPYEPMDKLDTHYKYVTFKREDVLLVSDGYMSFPASKELVDAVVIRRQDKFACPALLTYANMIEIVAKNHPDPMIRYELQKIADYFHEQGVLAGEEGYKLPTI